MYQIKTYVRALYQMGKLDNLINEVENIHLDIIGVAEKHWTEEEKLYERIIQWSILVENNTELVWGL